ncbi:unnamed protein product [Camellia sinensis]
MLCVSVCVFGRATQKFKILWLRFKLRVSFTVCVWESYTEIFSGLRKSQKMARNNAQGEKQHSGASTASTSASVSASASATIRVRSRPDPFLVVCRCFSIVTSAAAILCISVNILSAIRSFKDGSDIFDGIFRCYAVVIAMFVVVAETEWGFIIKFWKVLEYWAARGGVQVKLCGIAQYGNLIGVTIGYTITASISMFLVCLPPHKTTLEKLRDRLFEIFFQDDPLHRFKNQACCRKLLLGLQFFFPVFQWGPNYSLNLLRSDVISGLTIASLAIPQKNMEQETTMEEALLSEKSDLVKEKQSFERWSSYQYVERAGSIIPTASLAGTEFSVNEIRFATASSDRYYPPSLHAPLISSPEPNPNVSKLSFINVDMEEIMVECLMNFRGANNLIPMEIVLKIAEKIRARERFVAYIVIPMWPEGNPTSAATQRILFWQNKTMQMMYETIYKALVEVGLQNEYTPQDYLNLRSYLESTGVHFVVCCLVLNYR